MFADADYGTQRLTREDQSGRPGIVVHEGIPLDALEDWAANTDERRVATPFAVSCELDRSLFARLLLNFQAKRG